MYYQEYTAPIPADLLHCSFSFTKVKGTKDNMKPVLFLWMCCRLFPCGLALYEGMQAYLDLIKVGSSSFTQFDKIGIKLKFQTHAFLA